MLVASFLFLLQSLDVCPPNCVFEERKLNSYRIAQVFKVEPPPANSSPKPKKASKADEIKSEEDLWREGQKSHDEMKTEEGGEAAADEEGSDEWEEQEEVEASEQSAAKQEGKLPDSFSHGPVVTEEPAKSSEKKLSSTEEKPKTKETTQPTPATTSPETTQPPPLEAKSLTFRFPAGSRQQLAAIWEKRRLHLMQHDLELAEKDLEEWLKLKEELDLRNLFHESLVLLREADKYRKAANTKAWEETLDAAVAAAPDFPDARLARAWMWFKTSPRQLGRVIGEIWQALRAFWSDPRWWGRFLTNEVMLCLIAFLLAAILFIAVHFFTRLRYFYHDFAHIFPRGVSPFQSGILLTLLLLIPVLFHWGLMSVVLLMAVIAFLYGTWRQRVVILVALTILGAFPLGLKWVVWRWQSPSWLSEDLIAVVRGPATEKNLERLRQHLLQNSQETRVLAVLGDYHKRMGELQQAEGYLRQALASDGRQAAIANNLGNVMFLKKDLNAALTFYDQAMRLAPHRPEPYYNLSRLYYATLNLEKAKQMRESASRLDEQLVRTQNQRAESGLARDAVLDMPYDHSWLLSEGEVQSRQAAERATRMLWRWLGGMLEPTHFSVFAVLLGGGLLLLALLARGWRLSQPCQQCGGPVCRRCEPQLLNYVNCIQCQNLLHRQSAVDARSKIAKEIQIRKYKQRRQRIAHFLTIMVPGSGQMIKERTGRAVPMLFLGALVAVHLILPQQIMAYPYSLVGESWLWTVPFGIVGLLVWSWAIWDVFRDNG